jgi:hypothetical protein
MFNLWVTCVDEGNFAVLASMGLFSKRSQPVRNTFDDDEAAQVAKSRADPCVENQLMLFPRLGG